MPEDALYNGPWSFLCALAKRLHITPDRVPSQRATEELIAWLEGVAAAGQPLPAPFLRVAARLVYEHAQLVLPPTQDDVFDLAERLRAGNRGRPQAAAWQRRDWLKLACLVLENRRLPTAALFREESLSPQQVILNVELPFAARYVEEAPEPDARRLATPPLLALLERAEQLLITAADEVEEARAVVDELRTPPDRVPRHPPSRSNSANPSHELSKFRSNSAK